MVNFKQSKLIHIQVNLCQKLSFLASINQQYDNRLFIELQGNTSSAHVVYTMSKQKENKNNLCTHVLSFYFYVIQ